MPTESIYTKLATPVPVSLKDVDLKRQTTYFMAGIVNPMGPTLGILSSDGDPDSQEKCRMLWFSYNPFQQDCTHVGDVVYGDSWSPHKDLVPFLDIPFSGAPTLLVPGAYLDEGVANLLFSLMLVKFPDGDKTLKLLKRFPRDPWNRVKEEMNGPGLLSTLFRRKPSGLMSKPLSEEDAEEFAMMQLKHEYGQPELQAFFYAWNGSIGFTGIKDPMSLDHLARNVIPHFAVTARLPLTRK